jgi:hypothetical protein
MQTIIEVLIKKPLYRLTPLQLEHTRVLLSDHPAKALQTDLQWAWELTVNSFLPVVLHLFCESPYSFFSSISQEISFVVLGIVHTL